jgi:ArsR family transcriptional regulator
MSNKKCYRAVFVILCICFANYAYGAGDAPDPEKISASDIYAMMESGNADYIIYDMRANFEYMLGHIPGSVNLPMRMIARRITEIPDERLVILIFPGAEAEEEGWKFLMDNGYDSARIKIFGEDMEQWREAGYPMENSIHFGC